MFFHLCTFCIGLRGRNQTAYPHGRRQPQTIENVQQNGRNASSSTKKHIPNGNNVGTGGNKKQMKKNKNSTEGPSNIARTILSNLNIFGKLK